MEELLRKIVRFDKVEELVSRIRSENSGVRIATTNGAFDIMHAGHIYSLVEAKSYGDKLIVCLNSDVSVKSYKSEKRPVIPEYERALMLAGMFFVDYVVKFDETDPRNVLERIKPDFHIKSKSGYKGIEGDIVEKYGGKIVLIEDRAGLSTSEIVQKVKNLDE